MDITLDESAIEEEADALAPRFGALAYRALFWMSIAAFVMTLISLVHAYRIYVRQDVVEALAPGGAVYRPAVYVEGRRPPIPVATTEEMLFLMKGGL